LRGGRRGATVAAMSPATATSLRLALFYAGIFSAVGIHLPFWPVWLKAQGLDATQIGVLLAATFFTKIISNPLVGQMVDRRGDRRRPMIALAAGGVLSFMLYALVDDFWGILAVTIVAGGFFAAMMPVGENLTMMVAVRDGLDYGRIRLWGSLSFIVAASAGGWLIAGRPPDLIMWLVTLGLALTLLACLGVPDVRAAGPAAARPPPIRLLLGNRLFLLFLLATSLSQVSHMIYYGFATLHWQAAGLSPWMIGLLWAEGVVAEIVLFAFSNKVVRRLGPGRLLVLAGIAGLVRWTVLAATTDPLALAAVQWLHAGTFGCMHLGAMHFIHRAAPAGLSARAQALYSSVTLGVASGLFMLFTGQLYAGLAGGAFLVMAALSAAAALTGLRLRRAWDGNPIA